MEDYRVSVKKSDITLDDLLQEFINANGTPRKVLDFEKISSKGFWFNIFMTERGAMGKTYNAKAFTYEEFLRIGAQTLWLRNIKKDIEKEAENFLKSDCPPKLKRDLHKAGDIDKGTLALYGDSALPYLKFQSINSGEDEKGTRVIYKYIVWDEFNVNNNRVQKLIEKFDSILHSTEDINNNYGGKDPAQLFIFANFKSINHPLMLKLGIKSVRHEITEYWVNDFPLMLLVVPQRDKSYKEKFLKENGKNGRVIFSFLMGTADHSYFNTALFDEINFVDEMYLRMQEKIRLHKLTISINEFFKPVYTVYHKMRYYTIFRINQELTTSKLQTKYHIVETQEKDLPEIEGVKKFYIINRTDIREGALTPNGAKVKNNLKVLMTRSAISFEDIAVRELFVSSIRY